MSTLIDNLVKALQVQDEAETNKPIITTLTSPEVIKKIGEALQPSKNPQPAYNFPQDINLAPNKTLMRQQPFGKQIMGISPQARVNTMTPEQAEWHNLVEEFSQGNPQVAAGLDIEKAKRDEQAEFTTWKAEKEYKKQLADEEFKRQTQSRQEKSQRDKDAARTLDGLRSKGIGAGGIQLLADVDAATYLNLLSVLKVRNAVEQKDMGAARDIVASTYGLEDTPENEKEISALVEKARTTTNGDIKDAVDSNREIPFVQLIKSIYKKFNIAYGGEAKPNGEKRNVKIIGGKTYVEVAPDSWEELPGKK